LGILILSKRFSKPSFSSKIHPLKSSLSSFSLFSSSFLVGYFLGADEVTGDVMAAGQYRTFFWEMADVFPFLQV
jgi:hypothetical protein